MPKALVDKKQSSKERQYQNRQKKPKKISKKKIANRTKKKKCEELMQIQNLEQKQDPAREFQRVK